MGKERKSGDNYNSVNNKNNFFKGKLKKKRLGVLEFVVTLL